MNAQADADTFWHWWETTVQRTTMPRAFEVYAARRGWSEEHAEAVWKAADRHPVHGMIAAVDEGGWEWPLGWTADGVVT